MSCGKSLITELNKIWYSNDHQWVKIISNYQKKYPRSKYSILDVIDNILSDDLLSHCHESVLPPTIYPYSKSDFPTARDFLEEKNLLRLPCIERGGILFAEFPEIFTLSTESAAFLTSGDSHHAFPNHEFCEQQQWSLDSIHLICSIFDLLLEDDNDKQGVQFYLHQPTKPTKTKYPGAVVVISPDHFLYIFDGGI